MSRRLHLFALLLTSLCLCWSRSEDVEPAWCRRRRSARRSHDLRVHFEIVDRNGAASIAPPSVTTALSGAKSWLEHRVKLIERGADPLHVARACANATSIFYKQDASSSLFHYYCRTVGCSELTACGPLKQVPEKHLDRCQYCQIGVDTCRQCLKCLANTSQPLLAGVPGADLIVYVLLDCFLVSGNVQLASGDACLRNATTGRPNAGWIAVCPSRFTDDRQTFQVAEILRQLLRVLGLSRSQMGFWCDLTGDRRTRQEDMTGYPSGVGDSTLQKFNKIVETRSGSIRVEGHRLVTPAVLAEARRHYDCPTLPGMEMEDFRDSFAWEKRLVGPFEILTESNEPNAPYMRRLVSRFTLAALQDTGWYDVDLSLADPLPWGKDHGCVFSSRGCLSTIIEVSNSSIAATSYTAVFNVTPALWARVKSQPAPNVEEPFCRRRRSWSGKRLVRCSEDGRSLLACNLQQVFSATYRYFEDSTLAGSDKSADDCPYSSPVIVQREGQPTTVAFCQESSQAPSVNWALEQYGHTSVCIQHGLPWRRRIDTADSWEEQTSLSSPALYIGGGCYRRDCLQNGSLLVWVGGLSLLCLRQGQTVDFSQTVRGVEYFGQIVCPSLDDYCPIFDCLHNCSWRGRCVNDSNGQRRCVCNIGYHGSECQLFPNGMVAPTTHSSFYPDISKHDTLFTGMVIANLSATAAVLVFIMGAIYLTQCRATRRKNNRSPGHQQDRRQSMTASQAVGGYTPLPDGVSHLAIPLPEVRTVAGASYPRQQGFEEVISETNLTPAANADGHQVGAVTHTIEPLTTTAQANALTLEM